MGRSGHVGRSPHGERGLKYHGRAVKKTPHQSLSSWRAWIEINQVYSNGRDCRSLSSWRAWIEIIPNSLRPVLTTCRSPHGERGLKYVLVNSETLPHLSLSSWRAWIEMGCWWPRPRGRRVSLSSWRAWIEIIMLRESEAYGPVALLMESVD